MSSVDGMLPGTAFNQLRSADQTRLLNVIDELRSHNVGQVLGEAGLPQLIVCGDQSSGKSSVLEALTRVRFPAKSRMCTTFATELRLRRDSTPSISSRIIAKRSVGRTTDDIVRLESFSQSFNTPDKFPDLIDAAHRCMAETSGGSPGAFFEDILQVQISGPELAPLTIVDLPGLIHFRGTSTGDRDVNLVTSLVQSYMKQSNSIILAVISAHNDINNQVVLDHISKIVPDGKRTLGIITKPDTLPRGSEKEQEYLDLARNVQNNFQYGWHVVRNRTYEERDSSNEERDEVERRFFENSPWSNLPSREVGYGIRSLRVKLAKLLLDHIRQSLPSINTRLNEDLAQTELDLKRLGAPRESLKDQQKYLADLGDKFTEYTREALDGRYQRRKFFDDPLATDNPHKRLRAMVRNLNDEFATAMLERGHRWEVVDKPISRARSTGTEQDGPIKIQKSEFLKTHVAPLAHAERGNELSGVANPLLIGSLFRQQSEPWEGLASAHLDTIHHAVQAFLDALLTHLTDERTCNQVLVHVIHPAMELRFQKVKDKLRELLTPYKDTDPVILDPQFPRKIWANRQKKVAQSVLDVLRPELARDQQNGLALSAEEVLAKISASNGNIDDKYGSNEILESMQAYYETAVLNFINNVASLAVEQCLLSSLPRIFSHATARELDDEKLSFIASESEEIVSERARLQRREKTLRKGIDTIRTIIPQASRMGANPRRPDPAQRESTPLPIRRPGFELGVNGEPPGGESTTLADAPPRSSPAVIELTAVPETPNGGISDAADPSDIKAGHEESEHEEAEAGDSEHEEPGEEESELEESENEEPGGDEPSQEGPESSSTVPPIVISQATISSNVGSATTSQGNGGASRNPSSGNGGTSLFGGASPNTSPGNRSTSPSGSVLQTSSPGNLGTSLFGGASPNPSSGNGGTSPFGGAARNPSSGNAGLPLFGSATPSTSGGFGGFGSGTPATGGGLFGSGTSTGSPAPRGGFGGPFGFGTSTTSPASGATAFGQATQPNGSGGGLFGSSGFARTGFGQPTQTSGFGGGASTTASGSGRTVFGQPTQTSASTPTGFGTSAEGSGTGGSGSRAARIAGANAVLARNIPSRDGT